MDEKEFALTLDEINTCIMALKAWAQEIEIAAYKRPEGNAIRIVALSRVTRYKTLALKLERRRDSHS